MRALPTPVMLTFRPIPAQKSVVETTVDSHDVFANLKNMLIEKTRQQHSWHADVANNLRVMQVNALEVS
jgi:hypothetical protein